MDGRKRVSLGQNALKVSRLWNCHFWMNLMVGLQWNVNCCFSGSPPNLDSFSWLLSAYLMYLNWGPDQVLFKYFFEPVKPDHVLGIDSNLNILLCILTPDKKPEHFLILILEFLYEIFFYNVIKYYLFVYQLKYCDLI